MRDVDAVVYLRSVCREKNLVGDLAEQNYDLRTPVLA